MHQCSVLIVTVCHHHQWYHEQAYNPLLSAYVLIMSLSVIIVSLYRLMSINLGCAFNRL
jgi:hypothetical protein